MPPQSCENCHKPATLSWPACVAEGTTTVYTCDKCRPAHWTGETPPRLIAGDKVDAASLGLLGRRKAAAYLDLSEDAFDQHVRPHVKVRMVGSKPMFARAELDHFAEGGAQSL